MTALWAVTAQAAAGQRVIDRRTAARAAPSSATVIRPMEVPATAAQLTWTRTTAPPVQRTGRAKIRLPGLPYRCRARPLPPAAPARLARARSAHKIGAAHPRSPPLAGRAVLCVPWRTLAGWSSEPGELSRIGPVTAGVARDLALAAAADVTCQWKVIVVGRSGRAVAVAKVRRPRAGARARSARRGFRRGRWERWRRRGGADHAHHSGRPASPGGRPCRGGTGWFRPIRGGSRGGHAGGGEGVLRPPVRDRTWWLHPRGGEPRLPGSGYDARARRGARSDMRVPHLPSACLAVRAGPHDRPPPGRPDLPVQPVS